MIIEQDDYKKSCIPLGCLPPGHYTVIAWIIDKDAADGGYWKILEIIKQDTGTMSIHDGSNVFRNYCRIIYYQILPQLCVPSSYYSEKKDIL